MLARGWHCKHFLGEIRTQMWVVENYLWSRFGETRNGGDSAKQAKHLTGTGHPYAAQPPNALSGHLPEVGQVPEYHRPEGSEIPGGSREEEP